ncbi:MAG TPA: MFS transporter [Gaiella sp.]|nr:MFS transporter [Gaiella sp.]
MISANSLSAAVQGQFMFVLPWMLLARGSSPQAAALATAFVYVPMLVTAVPAGAKSDNADPLRLMRWVTAVPLAVCALYPLAALTGRDWFWLVLLAAVVVGTTRNLSEGAVFRSLADTTSDEGLLRAHAIRTTVNQAALFGTGFIGLVLFRVGDAEAVMIGICVLYVAALAILAVVPDFGRAPDPDTLVRQLVADGMTSLLRNRLLRRIGWVTLTWSLFGGAAVGVMPAVLREHIGMDELEASATFVAGAVAVVLLTLPIVRASQRRLGAISTFVVASAVQGTTLVVFADARAALLAPLLYCVFLLANSAAAASLGGARAAEVAHDHQGMLNLVVGTLGLAGFLIGVLLVAGLLGPLGFGVVLALIGIGMTTTALAFRRSLAAA